MAESESSAGAAPLAFDRMTPSEVGAFERRVLASCCPDVLRGAGPPAYDRADRFRMSGLAGSLSASAR